MPYCSFETQVVTSSCNFVIFASSNFAVLTLFHIMADDRQKCYALPEQQAQVVQTLDSAIHRINHYPEDKY